ncbi:MAG: 1-acyl-sn-glycerol-3-phosphate acyltransferase [Bacteroidota bacterium]|nr:1-acyl-sn-glycerol-3-phosphate acyltransferase [Bacteroidota bacterium]MDP4204693.1 1-acyl-sn-glycerol-3-phosphate acyltransferase [Bacteroidota bacterium]
MNSDHNPNKIINIREVIAKKSAKAARRTPSFVINFLNRILHVEGLNAILLRHGHLKGAEFIDESLKDLNITFNLSGTENIPQTDQVIFASNHPLGGVDGLILISQITRLTGKPIKLLVNDFLMYIYPVADLFVPINKVGGQARGSLQVIDQAYRSDAPILIFPAGLCSRKNKGKIEDLKWNKHFIQKATQYKRDIIPVYFDGRNSNFFYNLAKIRKFLHIKVNLEMMLLPDEMFKHQGKTFNIIFGKPIPYTTFDHSRTNEEWATDVKQIVYGLKTQGNQK